MFNLVRFLMLNGNPILDWLSESEKKNLVWTVGQRNARLAQSCQRLLHRRRHSFISETLVKDADGAR